jgi:HPt (histidine-containing phosphotransfer) domain-containing protein
MIEADVKRIKHIAAAPSTKPVIDRTHPARMTLGDRRLEAEVLALFDRQAGLLLARMTGATPAAVASFAHTLKGSARGIGVWRVATAAEAVEQAARACAATEVVGAIQQLAAAVAEAQAAIADLLTR